MKKKLLIGTKNPGKIKRWSQYFWDMFDIVSLQDCWINLDVEESLENLRENSIKKAKIYAELSNCITLSEDTWFFIEALGGKPWVAVRRWWWELSNEISDEEYLSFFKDKIKDIENTRSYFELEITISTPDWIIETINKKSYWIIDKKKLDNISLYEAGYPLSNCFVNEFDGKTWLECSIEEREKRDEEIIYAIRNILKKFID